MSAVHDIECDLMDYCLKHKGKWWATHFWRNKETNALYAKLRKLDIGTVTAILGDGGPDYQKHIDIYEKAVKPILEKP